MCISTDLLYEYGASLNHFKKGEFLFHEKWPAHFYFQVEEGSIKMTNQAEHCDFIQGVFLSAESFGEPPLIGNFPYPANAQAIVDSKVWVLGKEAFLSLLKDNFEVHLSFTQTLAWRLCYKANLLKDMAILPPEQRILNIIDYFKRKQELKQGHKNGHYEVPFTRQLLADMTGLRVETVIRKIQYLSELNELNIIESKVYRH